MATIITAHIVHSRSRCVASQDGVIIQRLAPDIGPYMSRAIAMIHTQHTTGTATNSTAAAARSDRRAASRRVGGRSGSRPGTRRS